MSKIKRQKLPCGACGKWRTKQFTEHCRLHFYQFLNDRLLYQSFHKSTHNYAEMEPPKRGRKKKLIVKSFHPITLESRVFDDWRYLPQEIRFRTDSDLTGHLMAFYKRKIERWVIVFVISISFFHSLIMFPETEQRRVYLLRAGSC